MSSAVPICTYCLLHMNANKNYHKNPPASLLDQFCENDFLFGVKLQVRTAYACLHWGHVHCKLLLSVCVCVCVCVYVCVCPKYSDTQKICCNHSKIWTMWCYHRVMSPNDAAGMANSVDPDQTAPLGAVWSGSALFAQAYLSENLGSLR